MILLFIFGVLCLITAGFAVAYRIVFFWKELDTSRSFWTFLFWLWNIIVFLAICYATWFGMNAVATLAGL